jgi:hypothetical protein
MRVGVESVSRICIYGSDTTTCSIHLIECSACWALDANNDTRLTLFTRTLVACCIVSCSTRRTAQLHRYKRVVICIAQRVIEGELVSQIAYITKQRSYQHGNTALSRIRSTLCDRTIGQ